MSDIETIMQAIGDARREHEDPSAARMHNETYYRLWRTIPMTNIELGQEYATVLGLKIVISPSVPPNVIELHSVAQQKLRIVHLD